MSSRASRAALLAARNQAGTVAAVIEAEARIAWANANDGAECPPDRIPCPGSLAGWLADNRSASGDAFANANERLNRIDFCDQRSVVPVPEAGTDLILFGDPDTGWCFAFSPWITGVIVLGQDTAPCPDMPGVEWPVQLLAVGRAPGMSLHVLTMDTVHGAWLAMPSAVRPLHPLAPLIRAQQARPVRPNQAHLLITRARGGQADSDLFLARMPGITALSSTTLEAVAVDDEPLASVQPDTRMQRKVWRVSSPLQGELFPAPCSLAGKATAGALFEAAADMQLGADERSPLRADLMRLALTGAALTRSISLTEAEGAILIGGADTPANRVRFNKAMWGARVMRFEARPRIYWPMLDAEPGPVSRLGPARWWLDQNSGMRAYRLSGGLFRPATKWGALERTIAGIEGALTWGPSPGRGRNGRIPDTVQAIGRGGPGPEVFIPWWQVLRLAGEPCRPDADPTGTHGVRFRRRVETLAKAGYFTAGGGAAAPAGDTVEIVRRVRGGNGNSAGLMVRASARFCAAYVARNARVRLPATVLFGPP